MIRDIFLLIMCHLVGDYVLQNDFIANTKGDNVYHMFVHCFLYLLPFYIVYKFDVVTFLIILVTHFYFDTFKSRLNLLSYKVDQIGHYSVLLLLYGFGLLDVKLFLV